MNNKSAIIGGILLLLAALAAIAPYFAGMKAEASLRADHEIMAREMALTGLTIALDGYQRGYLESRAVTAITFSSGAADARPLRFELHHRINHLPSFAHGAMASATSELVLPPEMQQVAARFFGDRPPLTITTYLGMSGLETATLSSPAFKSVEGPQIEWQGIEGNSTRSGDLSHMTSHLVMPGLRYNGPEGTATFSDMHYSADMSRGTYDMWFGTAQVTLKSLQLGGAGEEPAFVLSNVRLSSNQQERGEVTDASVRGELGTSSFGEVALESALYDVELRNLDTKTMVALQTAMQESANSADESLIVVALLDALPALLKAQPELNIRNLQFKSSQGNFDGKLRLAFSGAWSDEMMENPLAVLALLKADVDIAISKSLLISLGQSQMHSAIAAMAEMQGEELSEEEIEVMASERAAQQLELLAANEYLLDKEDLYTSKLHFEQGQLTINGKPANELFGATTD